MRLKKEEFKRKDAPRENAEFAEKKPKALRPGGSARKILSPSRTRREGDNNRVPLRSR